MNKFGKNSLLILLALAFALTTACGADDPPANNKNNDGADVQEDVGVTDTDETDKDVDETGKDVDETDKDVDETDQDVEEDTDSGDNSYPPTAEDSAVIQALLEDPEAEASFTGVLVTFTKEAYNNDPAGFFIQAEKEGPAAFVAIDPTSLDPPVEAGNVVKFDVISVNVDNNNNGHLEIDAIGNHEVLGTFNDVSSFVQNIDDVDDLVTNLDDYSLELIGGTFTVTGPARFGGTGFNSFPVSTEVLDDGVELRMPETLAAPLVLTDGCVVTIAGTPLWRDNDTPQASAWTADDFELSECPLLTVTTKATSETTVEITFSREIDETTLEADGSQFHNASDDENFAVSAASAAGHVVTLTTSAQTPDELYILSISDTIADTLGFELQGGTAVEFKGYNDAVQAPTAANEIFITEIMSMSQGGTGDPGEYVEIYNPSATKSYSLHGCSIDLPTKTSALDPALVIAPGQLMVFVSAAGGLGDDITEDGTFDLGGLGNGGSTVSFNCNDIVIDTVTYPTSSAANGRGQSFQKSIDKLTESSADFAATWCRTPKDDDTYKYMEAAGGNDAKFGTPGEANFVCP